MSSALEIVARIGLTALVFLLITLLPWPNIDFLTEAIQVGVGYALTYDGILPVTYMFQLFFVELLLEGVFLGIKLFSRTASFIGAHKTPTE